MMNREFKYLNRNNINYSTLDTHHKSVNLLEQKITQLDASFTNLSDNIDSHLKINVESFQLTSIIEVTNNIKDAYIKLNNCVKYIMNNMININYSNINEYFTRFFKYQINSEIKINIFEMLFDNTTQLKSITSLFTENLENLQIIDIINTIEYYNENKNNLSDNLSSFIFQSDNYMNVCLIFKIYNIINPLMLIVTFKNNDTLNIDNYLSDKFRVYSENIANSFKNMLLMPSELNELNDILPYTNIDDSFSATLFEFSSNISDYDKLTVLESLKTPFWNGKLIKDCNINELKLNIFNTISDIFYGFTVTSSINFINPDDISFITYYLGNSFYYCCAKLCMFKDKLCILLNNINITSFFLPSFEIDGDINIAGNISINNYKENILNIDTNRNTTEISGKIGINKKSYEISGLLDIDNISVDEIINLFDNLTNTLLNSYDIISIILQNKIYDNDVLNDDVINRYMYNNKFDIFYRSNELGIIRAFLPGGTLFDYKNQCQSFEFDLYTDETENLFYSATLFSLQDIKIHFNDTPITFKNDIFLNRIKNMYIETSNLLEEFKNNFETDNIMSFMELIKDDNGEWYIASIRGFLKYKFPDETKYIKMICIMTLYNVSDIITSHSNSNTFINIINYYSKIHYFLNYASILLKNQEVFDNVFDGNMLFLTNKILNNSHFSSRIGLLEESYLYSFTNEEINQKCLFNEKYVQFNGKYSNELWNGDILIDDINKQIYKTNKQLFNNRLNGIFPLNYSVNSLRKTCFKLLFQMNGKTYSLNSEININTLLSPSIISKGDNLISGEFYVSNPNGESVFKVNNIDKCVYNAYNVGIGIDNPGSILEINDTSIQDVINQIVDTSTTIYNMNSLVNLLLNNNESQYINIISENQTEEALNNNYLIYKINTSSMLAKDITIIYDSQEAYLNGNTINEAKDLYPNYLSQLNIIEGIYQEILDYNMIYDNILIIKVVQYIVNISQIIIRCFNKNGNIYFLVNVISNIQNYNIKYNTNKNILSFYENQFFMTSYVNNLQRRINNIEQVYNLNEGLNLINIYNNENTTYVIKVNKETLDFYISDLNIDTLEQYNTTNFIDITYDKRPKYLNLLNSINIYYDLENIIAGNFFILTYEDSIKDYSSLGLCIDIDDSNFTLLICEKAIQDIIQCSLFTKGDTQLNGDLLIQNKNTKENYVSIDPEQSFVGIGTDTRTINYSQVIYDTNVTIDPNDLYSKHNVHIYNEAYPVMVSNRVQENINDTIDPSNINTRYFGTNSALTVKRTSNLYNFSEINNYSEQLDESVNETDNITHFRYGTDIAFEVCDKNNHTIELGDVQMTIDKMDSSGNLKAGFGVQVVDPGTDFTSSRRNIMYVDNDGSLFINKIILKGKELAVDENDNLTWGGKIVNLS
jgi:hypothetical protein